MQGVEQALENRFRKMISELYRLRCRGCLMKVLIKLH